MPSSKSTDTSPGETEADWMLIGRITGAFGIRGELKVESFSDFPDRFKSLRRIYLGPQHVPYRVQRARAQNGKILLFLDGVTTREMGAQLSGSELSVPRSEAAPLPVGHYFLTDLIGIDVETTTGSHLGAITDVLRTGANDVYVVKSPGKEMLVPGTQEAVRELDVEGRRMVVEPWILETEE